MPNNYNWSRPEAGPVPFGKLQRRAQEALNRIIPALWESAASAKSAASEEAGKAESLSQIDLNRASRLFFVSGEPGSGKSTLYLTLRAMTSNEEGFKKYGKYYKHQPELGGLSRAIRWLEPLDLEIAGDERDNLLAAVLVRLFDAIERSTGILSKPCEAAIKELEELATDIGIAWEGNLQARAGALDPATYSEEVMLAQRARLGVNNRLRRALNKLAKGQCCGCDQGTLFVLPVEDVYLKPDASLQLLRLLRMITIPRLFFLLMGDIKTVEALFTEKSLADWTAVAGTRLFTRRSDRLDEALTRARELRARYLRKLLPPGQRAEIQAMDWYEALDLEVGRPNISSSAVDTLERISLNVKLDAPPDKSIETRSLLAFLVSPSFSYLTSDGEFEEEEYKKEKSKREKRARGNDTERESAKESELKKHRSAYTALQILDATPREIMDLASALREVIRQRQELLDIASLDEDEDTVKTPLLLLCVRDIVNLVREEQSFLNEKEQKVLGGILPTRHYSLEDINFEMDRLCLQPAPRTWKKQGSIELWVRNHRSWDLTANDKFIDDSTNNGIESGEDLDVKNPFAKLPPRPAAWFVLLHDLAWEWSPDSVTGNLIEKLCADLNYWDLSTAKVASRRDREGCSHSNRALSSKLPPDPDPSQYFSGWAVWSDGLIYKHFPMPEFKTFRDIDCFLHVWSRGLKWLGTPEKNNPDRIISLWALAGWTVLADVYDVFADGSVDWYKDFTEIIDVPEQVFRKFKNRLKKKRKAFEYPADTDDEIEKWVKHDGWPSLVAKSISKVVAKGSRGIASSDTKSEPKKGKP